MLYEVITVKPVFALFHRVVQTDHVLENLVVGDVMSGGLAHTFISFTTESEHVDTELFLHLAGNGVNIIADKTDRTGGENGNRLGMKIVIGFLDRLFQLLLTAEDRITSYNVCYTKLLRPVM